MRPLNFLRSKAQASLAFLGVYGLAMLVIAAIGTSLYMLGLFDYSSGKTITGFDHDFVAVDAEILTNNEKDYCTVMLQMLNTAGRPLLIHH